MWEFTLQPAFSDWLSLHPALSLSNHNFYFHFTSAAVEPDVHSHLSASLALTHWGIHVGGG